MRCLALPIVLALVSPAVEADGRRPNVLLFMADDLNTALSGFGHPQCQTPRLDDLAARGVRFENMHCQYPVCGASRASMMTGLYPYTNGMLGNSGNLRRNLPDVVTMSQLFRQNGYLLGEHHKFQKQHLFEESTRVPTILSVPWMRDAAGRLTRHLTELIDLYPTLADLAELTPPEGLQGHSLVPLVKTPETDGWERECVFTISRNGGESIRTGLCASRGSRICWPAA